MQQKVEALAEATPLEMPVDDKPAEEKKEEESEDIYSVSNFSI
jgi:hypothetical protein